MFLDRAAFGGFTLWLRFNGRHFYNLLFRLLLGLLRFGNFLLKLIIGSRHLGRLLLFGLLDLIAYDSIL
ncbi:MAG: hypothetical protein A2Z38_12305 [Planctomycetes bacterium RBG_19FT_COMBO_48_8]|nr:MAG: hypothetical protein A2Z38_12305 [Planctomycetes bacterium RBG_19FT_COMBO_48_8]